MIKGIVKKLIYRYKSKTFDEIMVEVTNKEVVSFDVFDTAVKRKVASPKDVFKIIEVQCKNRGVTAVDDFAKLRIEAEKEARNKCDSEEVTLEEIYSYMPFDMELKNQLMRLECEIETEMSLPNIYIKKIYDSCVQQKKKIYFISDMYLPKNVIYQILKKNGYITGRLYVSSESRRTKHSGMLFSYVQEREALQMEQWAHIGDTISSDYLVPKRLGIKGILIKNKLKHSLFFNKRLLKESDEYRQVDHFISIHLDKYSSYYEEVGYAVLGPLLYGFARWLKKCVPKERDIIFLARDGAIMKKAFGIVFEQKTRYLYISRKAAYNAYIDQLKDSEEALKKRFAVDSRLLAESMKSWSYNELAMHYGLDFDEAQPLFEKRKIQGERIIENYHTKKEAVSYIWESVKEKAHIQHRLLQQYLEQLGVSDKCAIVDVGWQGGTQTFLEGSKYCIKGKEIDWAGYYFGVMYSSYNALYQASSEVKKYAFLFKDKCTKEEKKIYKIIRGSVALFEMFFSSADGSTKKYNETKTGNVYPVFDEVENDYEVNQYIQLIQNCALQFVSDFCDSNLSLLVDLGREIAFANYKTFVNRPCDELIHFFKKYNCSDGGRKVLFFNEHNLLYYLLHPKQFYIDFAKCVNKALFLRGVFKVSLPYFEIVDLLRVLFEVVHKKKRTK